MTRSTAQTVCRGPVALPLVLRSVGAMSRSLTAELLLLALDDATGKPLVDGTRLKAAVAGAAVVDLTLTGGLRLTEPGDPQAKAGAGWSARGRSWPTRDSTRWPGSCTAASPRTPWARSAARPRGRTGLATSRTRCWPTWSRRGCCATSRARCSGSFPTTAWPLARPGGRAGGALDGCVPPWWAGSSRTSAPPRSSPCCTRSDLLPKLFPDQPKRDIRARGKALSEGDWGGEAVRKAVQDVQSAVTAAVVASTAGHRRLGLTATARRPGRRPIASGSRGP